MSEDLVAILGTFGASLAIIAGAVAWFCRDTTQGKPEDFGC